MANAVIERYVLDDIHNGLVSFDGGNVVLDFVDPDGSGAQPMAMSKRYLYGEAVDQLFAQEDLSKTLGDATRTLWPLVDHLGTVRDVAKQDGTIAAHYKYDSFGNVTSGDTSKTRFLFTGREFDTATKLQYNRLRYYDAAVGRWISEDPLEFAAGDVNIGRYVGNQVVYAIDPSGMDGWGRVGEWYRKFGDWCVGAQKDNDPPIESWDGVPRAWPGARPRVDGEGDRWGLPIGPGTWHLRKFLKNSDLEVRLFTFGCGSFFAMRAGLFPYPGDPWSFLRVRNYRMFETLEDGLKFLKYNPGTLGLLEVPGDFLFPPGVNGEPWQGTIEAIDVNTVGQGHNWRVLIGTPDDWCWETAENAASQVPNYKVYHNQDPIPGNYIVIVVPGGS